MQASTMPKAQLPDVFCLVKVWAPKVTKISKRLLHVTIADVYRMK